MSVWEEAPLHARAAEQHQPVGWLVVFAEIEGFRWVVQQSRMAFSDGMARRARKLQPSDQLILYLGRGAFHSPTRDRSQLAGLATVTSAVERLPEVLRIAGMEFPWGCDLELAVVLPERQGLPIRELIPRLSFVQNERQWGASFRSGLIQLPDADLQLVTMAIRDAATQTQT